MGGAVSAQLVVIGFDLLVAALAGWHVALATVICLAYVAVSFGLLLGVTLLVASGVIMLWLWIKER